MNHSNQGSRVDFHAGCGAAWLARLTGGQEVAGSNPVSPIFHNCLPNRELRYLTTFVSAAENLENRGNRYHF